MDRASGKVLDYKELVAWQKAMDLTVAVYKVSCNFPKEEQFGLCSQIRRAAVSVPSNIAEGQGRGTTQELIHFLRIAQGSLQELETQMILAARLAYINEAAASQMQLQINEVRRVLSGFLRSLSQR